MMKLLTNTVIIGCSCCHNWRGEIREALRSSLSGRRLYCCPICRTPLVDRSGEEYFTLNQCGIVEMKVEALTDLDLAKLLLRSMEMWDLKSGERGKSHRNKLLESSLKLIRLPSEFDIKIFDDHTLLKEQKRREECLVTA
jgi:hypothetical protein